MPIELKMPALSPTMEEGTLAKWLVKEGDNVAAGDLLAEIETDKATMEFEAVDEGTISRIVVPEAARPVRASPRRRRPLRKGSPRPRRRPRRTREIASRRARWRGGWPSRRAWTFRASRAPAPADGS